MTTISDEQKTNTFLVTGCAGFIGSAFCTYVKELNPETRIIGIDNFFNSSRQTVHQDIEFIEGDICDTALIGSIFEQYEFDGVFHFAAIPQVEFCQQEPLKAFQTNVVGTHILLEHISFLQKTKGKSPKFIFSSSAAIYGNTSKVPVEESDPKHPAGFYGLHKLQCEELINQYVEHAHISAVSLRYFNVYGPGQKGDSAYATVIAKWFDQIKKGLPIRIDGDGTQSRDFIYIDSIIDANLLAFAKGEAGQAYNIASGHEIDLLQLKDVFEKVLFAHDDNDKKLPVDYRDARPGDIKKSLASTTKARQDLGFEVVDRVEENLITTARWWGLV